MTQANFVKEVVVTDPDSKAEVELSVFKHSNGAMFAMDSSWLEQCPPEDDEDPIVIRDLFEPEGQLMLFGL